MSNKNKPRGFRLRFVDTLIASLFVVGATLVLSGFQATSLFTLASVAIVASMGVVLSKSFSPRVNVWAAMRAATVVILVATTNIMVT